ncbi:putative xanthine/uracil/vitamin C permease [Helianthus annuus]|uniref:Putative nucleobase-ascorbate transporter 12 n=1 Tax=Helianthus annuus TaxID=4232 RepID=A0A251SND2_HELAN|nr:nucleobase-ascorbate transporter 12 [Helianthus annuus]KAF5770116.1 putative xanthine/uracil/vitamin C permease [Helianthus annuus]KAJ0469777.1 putative xanthine/uracil/vitamin C permease [Helianthus annuus]KAJ0854823.1 putative xanthine/uracil/vitamin C permease [Helianthus annuus]
MAQSSDPNNRPKPGPLPPAPHSNDPPAIPPSSWAKRTGFRPRFSGETNATDSGPISNPPAPKPAVNGIAAQPANAQVQVQGQGDKDQAVKKRREGEGRLPRKPGVNRQANNAVAEAPAAPAVQPSRRGVRNGDVENPVPRMVNDEFVSRQAHMKYELRDTPGLVPIGFYGFQHYLSMMGSLILIPLVIVPAMGGDHEDMSMVVSTVLFVSGITTLLQANFGSRLPLIQGPSFVFLAPALAIIKSPEFLGLNGNNFKHIMKELQGAIIIASAFQALLGYSGLMTLLLRLINPVVVSPTVAAVGLSFYSYGFPQMGACLEIGMVQILLVIMFSLYLRKISLLGHRIFLIYAVPLGLAITWAMSFLLTEAGAYKYDGCDVNIPTSNMISDHCRKHVARMKTCRADASHALNSSPWFRFPYPLQWGIPVFNWKMAVVMCVVSVISSVDSVGSYHASSLLVASRPPTPGVVSRGIGLEGLCSVLAGLWGTGTGSTSLTENVHTIAVTKMGSRTAVELGAFILIILSLVGKVGGFIASIPQVMVAGLLCIMWAMLVALGLSNLRYSEAGSSRNIIIIGLSLFLSLSVPAYFQQYGLSPNSNSPVPTYFQPYIVASHGPFRSQYRGVNYVMNTLLSFHMVIAFIVAVVLDNTVPGSKQERGVYVWSEPDAARREPAVVKDYGLPFRVGKMFKWVRWVGL